MEIIQTELRLKDIEWVQKQLEGLKKTGRSLGSNSLADKARKEEIVNAIKLRAYTRLKCFPHRQRSKRYSSSLVRTRRMSGRAIGLTRR